MTRDGKPRKRKEDSWQAKKGAKTRESILDGAIDCYAKLGYSKTTTSTIVNSANVSRGAMAHHFSSLADVVQAAAEHIKNKRLADSRRRFSKLENLQSEKSRVEAIRIYWKWLLTKEATAYYELREVSRTDKELNKVMTGISEEFDGEYRKIIEELFPELDENPELETLSEDMLQYLLEGMAMDYRVRGKKNKEKVERLIIYVGETMGKIWGATD
jgi:AcrR family transcriptional regulator